MIGRPIIRNSILLYRDRAKERYADRGVADEQVRNAETRAASRKRLQVWPKASVRPGWT